jgi:hypothetical protein
MNYKYNELSYAELIYNNGFQTKYIPTELKLLVLYFRDVLGLKPKEREFEIYKFCQKYIPNFRKENFFKAINKALKVGAKKEEKLVVVSSVDIYKLELDYINSLDVNQEYKKVLFTFLVQLKLNKTVYEYKYDKEYNNKYFQGGLKKYNNIKKISNIPHKMSLNDEVINTLNDLKLITILHKGMIYLDYIENCLEDGEVVITITDFENIGLYLDYHNGIKGVIKCENCGKLIKMKNNKQKYCDECAREIEKSNWAERKRKQRENVTK